MGVTRINYKVAECDICGTTEQFTSSWNMPDGWGGIADSCGVTNYGCVCPKCLDRISGYIKNFKESHHKKKEGK